MHRKQQITAALTLLVGFCILNSLTGQAQSSSKPQQRPASSPQESKGISALFDYAQINDPSVPAFIRSTIMSGEIELRDKAGLKAVVVENRSGKTVKSLKLRWTATEVSDRMERKDIYGQGQLSPIDVRIAPGEKAELKVAMPQMTALLKSWWEEHPDVRWIAITLGISEIVFEDGSIWVAAPIN